MKIMFIVLALLAGEAFGASFQEIAKVNTSVWGMDFLPNGKMIFTKRDGKLYLLNVDTRELQEVTGVPRVAASGQGGLLDVRVHPDFKNNSLIYISYSEPVGNVATTAIMRAKLEGTQLVENQKIFSGHKPTGGGMHYGSRIAFDGKGHVFFTMGERNQREFAQQLTHHQGKLMRLNDDGTVPSDNPFVGVPDAKPEIWNLGLRSPQGLAVHPVTGDLWEAEMGPLGGDEINLITKGGNLGWPVITYGREYSGETIGTTSREGLQQPVAYWVPSISPSGIDFYTGDKYPQWKNHLFIGCLSGQHVRRVVLDGSRVISQEKMLENLNYRWRSVRSGPDGYLYLSTDDGRVGRLLE